MRELLESWPEGADPLRGTPSEAAMSRQMRRQGRPRVVELTIHSTHAIMICVPEFGEALRDLRRAVGMSQRELARRTGLDFSYISKLENGRMPPPAGDTVVSLATALDLPPEELLALTGKLPSAVHKAVSRSTAAQRFLIAAERMGLDEDEWQRIEASLERLRDLRP